MRPLTLLLAVAALALLGGCNTFDRRAEQKAATFATLDADTRERLKNKSIRIGDTPDMVFIALGKADEIRSQESASAETVTWIYNRYWREYQGMAYTGMRPRTMTDPKTGATRVYYETTSEPVYAQRQKPYLRIIFDAGKVSVIERAQD